MDGHGRYICSSPNLEQPNVYQKVGDKTNCRYNRTLYNRTLLHYNIHIIEHYSAIKRNELMIHTITWIEIKMVMLSEKPDQKKSIFCMIPFT